MTLPATEIVFLPGFDGTAELRAPFVEALGERHPARSIGYPNRKLDSLNGYVRYAVSHVTPESRPVLVAESFSGLVAARWAAKDPHVAGVVLCGCFARNPVAYASIGASFPSLAQFLGANLMAPAAYVSGDPARQRWSQAFGTALRSLSADVIAERLRIIATEDVSEELRAIQVPIVLVQFDDDLVIGSGSQSHLESLCGAGKVVRFAGPHFALETRARECAEAIGPHLAGLFAAPPRS